MQELNLVNLQSNIPASAVAVDLTEAVNKFVVLGTIIAIALPRKNTITVWFMEIVDFNQICIKKKNNPPDSYDHIIAPGMPHLSGLFLEKNDRFSLIKKSVYSRTKKVTYFFKESILYPYISMQQGKHGLKLSAEDYTDILLFIERNRFSQLQAFLEKE